MSDNSNYFFNNSTVYSSEELVSIFQQLSAKIQTLHTYSSDDFKALNKRIRGYYEQSIIILETVSQLAEIISKQAPTLSQQVQNSLRDISTLVTKLQFHDIIRQKLEHIQKINQDIVDEIVTVSTDSVDKKNNQPNKYIPILPDIARLHAAQLTHANQEYQHAFVGIKNTLNAIQENTNMVSQACSSFFNLLENEQNINNDAHNQSERIINLADKLSKEITSSLQEIKHCESFEKLVEEINYRLNTTFPDPYRKTGNQRSQEENAILKELRNSYTMESERTVHNEIFNSHHPTNSIEPLKTNSEDDIELF